MCFPTHCNKKQNMEIEQLRENVNKAKDDFLAEVNRLNYVITLMDAEPIDLSHSSLTTAVRGVSKSYEDYVNSKIEFTEKYFQEKYKI